MTHRGLRLRFDARSARALRVEQSCCVAFGSRELSAEVVVQGLEAIVGGKVRGDPWY